MTTMRKTAAALALALGAALPVAAFAAEPPAAVPAKAPVHHAAFHHAAFRETALSDLRLAREDLSLGHRTAAEHRLERAETRVLNARSAIEGTGASGTPWLDKGLTAIEAARADAIHGKLPQATRQALAAARDLRAA